MEGELEVISIGPSVSVQDLGRPGYLAQGLTVGGAADRMALYEGAALLAQDPGLAAIEMVGMGGTFRTSVDLVVAVTGACMRATIDGTPAAWNASHAVAKGAEIKIGSAVSGGYGYLHLAGGIDTEPVMGARSTHLKAGVGRVLRAGDLLPLSDRTVARPGYRLEPDGRFSGGEIRVLASLQTDLFPSETRRRFEETEFKRDARGNRQGVRMESDEEGFFAEGGLSILSEVIVTGDIQITGDGAPYVLMCESQTTGGYPRIGTVIPSDLPRVAQAPIGAPLRFRFVALEEAREIERRARENVSKLRNRVEPLVRDPAELADLLSYQLISGAFSATSNPFET